MKDKIIYYKDIVLRFFYNWFLKVFSLVSFRLFMLFSYIYMYIKSAKFKQLMT